MNDKPVKRDKKTLDFMNKKIGDILIQARDEDFDYDAVQIELIICAMKSFAFQYAIGGTGEEKEIEMFGELMKDLGEGVYKYLIRMMKAGETKH